jgi:hypothetical protein
MTAPRRNILIGSAVLGALLLALIVPNFRRAAASLAHPDPVGPTAYSKSAIGHIAFYNLLESLEIPTEISENGSGAHVGPGDVLLVAEPRTDQTTLGEVKAMLDARTVLLVLPKRTGKPDPNRPYWLLQDKLVAEADVNAVLHLVDNNASIVRAAAISEVAGDDTLSGSPSLNKPQLMRSKLLRPMLTAPEGMLIGERRLGSRRIVVLSDPDIISNHALAHGDNSVLAVSLIERLQGDQTHRSDQGSVIFDEFVHGFAPKPFNLLNILFQFPFVLVTVQMAAVIALLIWAATGRFGAPLAVTPPLEAGKRSLIDTGARLLTQARRIPDLSQRYVEAVVADTARCLRTPVAQVPDLPVNRSPQEIWQWRKKLLGESRAHTKLD